MAVTRAAGTPRLLLPALLAAALLLSACSHLGYYAQAIRGHLAVMHAAVPLAEAQRAAGGDPALQHALATVHTIRDFASRELALPDNGSYRSYADLGRPYVVWNVFAAGELSLTTRQWCFVIVGCVDYRGYYEQQDAEQLAGELREQGYDTYVAGVPAYSTLGAFDDPVLNTFLRYGSAEVARTIFHELAHQIVFVADDTAFNESFATVVENEGMRRWLACCATDAQRTDHALQHAHKIAFLTLLRDYRQRFAALYAGELPAAEKRAARAQLFTALRAAYARIRDAHAALWERSAALCARSAAQREADGAQREASLGSREASGGVREASVGVREASVGGREASVGGREAFCGLREASCEPREASGEPREASCSLSEAPAGVSEASAGVSEASAGVREACRRLREAPAALPPAARVFRSYDAFFARDLNNAKLASIALYDDHVPAFAALLADHDRDLPQFYAQVTALAKLAPEPRRRALAGLAARQRVGR